ncbi:MAG TPA: hypothetical protein VF611_14665, partial [Pyrinomonadaceae bacterium]
MSHFLTFVLVGPGEADAVRRAHELLAPYFAADGAGDAGDRSAKFDGCVVGGRFDGQLFGAEPMYNLTPAEFQRRYGMDVLRDEDNIRPASEVPDGLTPYALVTPAGEWRDCEGKDAARWE